MQHLAIFGGTFNPVHNGHCAIAEAALRQFGLDRIIWVPAFNPPHKSKDMPAFKHRLAMVERAIDHNPAFTVSHLDQERPGASYAIATLRDFQILYPDTCWYWILGIDSFQTLPQWHESEQLAATCTWLIAPRGGEKGKGEGVGMQRDGGNRGDGERLGG